MAAPEAIVGPINLGNPVETTIKELAEIIIAMTESSSDIEYHPLPVDDPVQRCPDISRAIDDLGWQPRISLDKGLGTTIAYFQRLMAR
jgi:UDP-glucuronate decarboxylase